MQGGGIPTGVVELKLTFKDGGAFDFHTKYEQVRERLLQAVEVAGMGGRGAMQGVNVQAVDLEELPVYSEVSDGPLVSPVAANVPRAEEEEQSRTEAPSEPPPAYEAAQMDGLQGEMERQLGEEEREVWGGEAAAERR